MISCGGHHSAIITPKGEVYLWGRNTQGQCGKPPNHNHAIYQPMKLQMDNSRQIKNVDCGEFHTAIISSSGELFMFGDNSEGQLGVGLEYKAFIERPTLIIDIKEEIQ